MFSLTRQEQQLQNILLDVAKYIDESKEIKSRLELRFAGGWVRDKLLGIPSHDIDTAINSMTGKAYGQKVYEFLSLPGHREKHGLSENDVGNFHVIEANQEKSKHLETVTVSLLGLDLDFVNLRTETYSEDSRNPQMEFGTPEEDALRRDATINALFYNLHTGKVEDYVGGLADLDAKLIRTPVKPYQTFMDDPLRVLRLIRFASRLDFSIDPESETAMSHPNVLEALKSGAKISRERVGTEVEKMLKGTCNTCTVMQLSMLNIFVGPNPRDSLKVFDRLGLYSTIFAYEDSKGRVVPQPETLSWKTAYDCLATIRADESPDSINKTLLQTERNPEAAYHAWLLAALTPWASIPSPPNPPGGKMEEPPATQAIRGGMKSSTSLCNLVTGAVRSLPEISEWKTAVTEQRPWIHERDNLGMAIRRWNRTGGDWRMPVLFAIMVEAIETTSSGGKFDLLIHSPLIFAPYQRITRIREPVPRLAAIPQSFTTTRYHGCTILPTPSKRRQASDSTGQESRKVDCGCIRSVHEVAIPESWKSGLSGCY